MSEENYQGSCHCGQVTFRVKADLTANARCNCSICRRKGTPMVLVEPENFELLSGQDSLQLYQFNKKIAKHFFCTTCGIYPFHQPRSAPEKYRVNAGCLEGVDPFTLETPVLNGQALD